MGTWEATCARAAAAFTGREARPGRAPLAGACPLTRLPRPLKNWGPPWLVREILTADLQRLVEIAAANEDAGSWEPCSVFQQRAKNDPLVEGRVG